MLQNPIPIYIAEAAEALHAGPRPVTEETLLYCQRSHGGVPLRQVLLGLRPLARAVLRCQYADLAAKGTQQRLQWWLAEVRPGRQLPSTDAADLPCL